MKTPLCEELGIEVPIFAFSKAPAVVAAVSRAGGMGVLGAVAYDVDQLREALDWIDAHVDGKPYGVDVVMPMKYEGAGAGPIDPAAFEKMIPERTRAFVEELLARHEVPPLPEGERSWHHLLAWTEQTTRPQVDLALERPIKLLANALGPPPKDIVDRAHAKGIKVAALTGAVDHALKHIANGVDIIVAQGTEAGGHCGEIATMVLVPEIVDAVGDTPVLAAGATGLVEVALKHPIGLIASALGPPPPEMVAAARAAGVPVAALVGTVEHARRQVAAGADLIVAQGTEAGGHTGEISTMVLVPQVVDAVAPVPVLAAGGIGSGQQIAAALALGAQGAWTGSQWVMVEESEHTEVQHAAYAKATSRDTVRSRSFTGKPARMLRNDWTDAWENPDNPKPLGMPLQYMVSGMAVAATHKYPNESVDVAFNPIGQVVGQFTKVEKSSAVIERWVQEYLEATNTLNELNEAASV